MRCLAVLLVLIFLPPVHAQTKPGAQTSEEPLSDSTESSPDPYADPGRTLPYLAYTLGQLHYLAYACEGSETQQWRERMIELLRLEAPLSGYRRDRLIDAFNDGYQVEQRAGIRCGAEAEAERRTLARRGAEMSQAMLNNVLD